MAPGGSPCECLESALAINRTAGGAARSSDAGGAPRDALIVGAVVDEVEWDEALGRAGIADEMAGGESSIDGEVGAPRVSGDDDGGRWKCEKGGGDGTGVARCGGT